MTREERIFAFPKGCRVRLSAEGRAHGLFAQAKPDGNYAVVTGHGRRYDTIKVKRDNRSTHGYFHWTFWDRCDHEPTVGPAPTPQVEEHW